MKYLISPGPQVLLSEIMTALRPGIVFTTYVFFLSTQSHCEQVQPVKDEEHEEHVRMLADIKTPGMPEQVLSGSCAPFETRLCNTNQRNRKMRDCD